MNPEMVALLLLMLRRGPSAQSYRLTYALPAEKAAQTVLAELEAAGEVVSMPYFGPHTTKRRREGWPLRLEVIWKRTRVTEKPFPGWPYLESSALS